MAVMRIRLEPAVRWPPWPWWAVAIVALWVALGCLTIYLSHRWARPVVLCAFRRITGLACPTCGSTRSATLLIRGDVGAAFRTQPFMVTAAAVLLCLTLLRVLFARRLRIETTPALRRMGLGLVLAALVANWAYVICFVG